MSNNIEFSAQEILNKVYDPVGGVLRMSTSTFASGILTSDTTNVSNNDTVTLGSVTYTFKTALTEAKASGTLTSDATAPSDGDTVTLGSTVYTFKTTLSTGPTVPFEVLIGASAAIALDNLKSAVNLTAGIGTTYSTGTTIHPTVDATTNTDTTQLFVAKAVGTAGNIVFTENGTHTTADGSGNLTGGVNAVVNQILIGGTAAASLDNLEATVNALGTEGTTYSTGTVVHPTVYATDNTDTTQGFKARTAGTSGNSIATTETSTHLAFGDVTLVGGV